MRDVRDYINLYESIEPQFMGYNGNFQGTYYSREESFKFLKQLLMYQFEDNDEAFLDFSHYLYRL